MKKAVRKLIPCVHFGDPEDILSTTFFNDGLMRVSEEEKSEEEKKKEEIQTRLVQTLKGDDVSMLKHLLVEIPDLVDTYLTRPLAHLAAEYGALQILQECVSKPEVSVNAASPDFEATTPLYWAIREGHGDVADWLLSNGAFHQPLNVYQDTAVYVAVYYKQTDILDVLQAHRCDCSIPNGNGDLPLIHVIRTGNIEALDRLIKMGVDIYGKTSHRWGIPIFAALDQPSQVAFKIIDFALSGNRFNAFAQQPLLCGLLRKVVEIDSVEIAALLLKRMDPLEVDETKLNTQYSAASQGAVNCMRLFVSGVGVSWKVFSRLNYTSVDMMQYVLATDGQVRDIDIAYRFVEVCRQNRLENFHPETIQKLQLLLKHGYNLNTLGSRTKMTPIYLAVQSGLLCIVLFLLRAGCDVSLLSNGKSPICAALNHLAIHSHLVRIAYLLVEFLPSHNDPSIGTYLSKIKSSKDDAEQVADPMIVDQDDCGLSLEEFNRLLLEKSTNPKSLGHLSRIAIIQALGMNAFDRVQHLGLPPKLVEYIQLFDLEHRICEPKDNLRQLCEICYH